MMCGVSKLVLIASFLEAISQDTRFGPPRTQSFSDSSIDKLIVNLVGMLWPWASQFHHEGLDNTTLGITSLPRHPRRPCPSHAEAATQDRNSRRDVLLASSAALGGVALPATTAARDANTRDIVGSTATIDVDVYALQTAPPDVAQQVKQDAESETTASGSEAAVADIPKSDVLSPSGSRRELTLRSGAKMPLVGLGTAGIGLDLTGSSPREVGIAVQAALDAGCRHFDCAAVYQNEAEVGVAIAASGIPRNEIFLTSKLWNDNRRPADIRAALAQTLSRLGTHYLDLYLIHWPVVWAKNSVMKPDMRASLKVAWQTLEQLVDEGKIRNIGISNYNIHEIEDLLSYARILPVVNQIELHPRLPQTDLVKYCQSKAIGVTAYSPLGQGNNKMIEHPIVRQIAATHSVSPASVILRWNIQRDVVVIPKSVKPARIRQNLQEPWTFELSSDEIRKLDALNDGERFCKAPWSTFEDRTVVDRVFTGTLSVLARGLFSVASLDLSKGLWLSVQRR